MTFCAGKRAYRLFSSCLSEKATWDVVACSKHHITFLGTGMLTFIIQQPLGAHGSIVGSGTMLQPKRHGFNSRRHWIFRVT
jgi:hypothetical protein